MMTHKHGWTLGLILLFAVVGAFEAGQGERTKSLGRTAAEFQDQHVRAAVDWIDFELRPNEKWAFLELWVMPLGLKPITIKREDISLLLPDGSRLPVPGQAELASGYPDIRRMIAMTDVPQERIGNTFRPRKDTQRFGFHEVPGTPRFSFDSCTVGPFSAGYGDIFFANPNGRWDPGTYTLEVRNKDIAITIPFGIGIPTGR